MRKKDFLWLAFLIVLTSLLFIPVTKKHFESLTINYPYIMGFIKTAILATMGELLVMRIKTGRYFNDRGMFLKFIVWGFLGMIFVIIFKIFGDGVKSAQQTGFLLVSNVEIINSLLYAFLTSVFMNVFFAPSFMLLHRVTDGFIDQAQGAIKNIFKVKLSDVIDRISLNHFVSFVLLKTIPFFWIPAHTITFLLPETYRVLMAAYLSIALGFILTISKYQKKVES